MHAKAENIDAYIATFPDEVQKLLQQIRATIKKAAPKAEEAIKYGMPTFVLNGNLVHFAAFKNHIGFYPAPDGITAHQKKLAKYKTSKGAIQFPLAEKLPLGLITEIVKYRAKQNLKKDYDRLK